jgi:hypothetical protein
MAEAPSHIICANYTKAVIKKIQRFFFVNYAYFASKICYNIILIPLCRLIIHIVHILRDLLHGCGTLVSAERLD